MKSLKSFTLLLCTLWTLSASSQELNCIVSVNTSQIQGTNKEIFYTLRDAITDFMNNTAWTNNTFEVYERIECTMMFNINEEVTTGSYRATLSIQSRRPIYGSSYNSVMLNYVDNDVDFRYTENDPLEFSDNSHISNLTSILAYYAYIIIGLDYDSFSHEGGTPYFMVAEKIVTNAQSASDPGWKAFESDRRKNRYWLVDNILNDDYSPLREFNYKYHRLGLDVMDEDDAMVRGRTVIRESVIELERFYRSKPDPFMHYFQILLDAKANEIVQIFSEAPPADKTRIYTVMTTIDPANTSRYESLKSS
jgi:hypothetical protein